MYIIKNNEKNILKNGIVCRDIKTKKSTGTRLGCYLGNKIKLTTST